MLDQILGPEDKKDADKRREELIREREEQGLPTDEETVNRLLEEQRKAQGKQRRIVSSSILVLRRIWNFCASQNLCNTFLIKNFAFR